MVKGGCRTRRDPTNVDDYGSWTYSAKEPNLVNSRNHHSWDIVMHLPSFAYVPPAITRASAIRVEVFHHGLGRFSLHFLKPAGHFLWVPMTATAEAPWMLAGRRCSRGLRPSFAKNPMSQKSSHVLPVSTCKLTHTHTRTEKNQFLQCQYSSFCVLFH